MQTVFHAMIDSSSRHLTKHVKIQNIILVTYEGNVFLEKFFSYLFGEWWIMNEKWWMLRDVRCNSLLKNRKNLFLSKKEVINFKKGYGTLERSKQTSLSPFLFFFYKRKWEVRLIKKHDFFEKEKPDWLRNMIFLFEKGKLGYLRNIIYFILEGESPTAFLFWYYSILEVQDHRLDAT